MLAANRQKVLQALGIRSWVQRSAVLSKAESAASQEMNPLFSQQRRMPSSVSSLAIKPVLNNVSSKIAANLANDAATDIPVLVRKQQDSSRVPPRQNVQSDISFRLILQPITHNTLIIAELNDPQAPGLSAQEQRLLANICLAVQRCLALEHPPALVGETGLFSWPASTHASLLVDPEQALQGLLAAQKNRGFSQFILLGSSVSVNLGAGLEESRYQVLPSLYEIYQQPKFKRQVWEMLKQLTGYTHHT